SGETYQKFIQDNLLTPLGVKDTGYDFSAAVVPNRASGYIQGPSGMENAPVTDMSILFSAGALYSTADDLFRWERGLFGGKILSASSLKKMTTAATGNFGMGVMIENANGDERISHGGGIEGFSSWLAYSPKSQITVAVLGNVSERSPDSVAGALANLVLK